VIINELILYSLNNPNFPIRSYLYINVSRAIYQAHYRCPENILRATTRRKAQNFSNSINKYLSDENILTVTRIPLTDEYQAISYSLTNLDITPQDSKMIENLYSSDLVDHEGYNRRYLKLNNDCKNCVEIEIRRINLLESSNLSEDEKIHYRKELSKQLITIAK